MHKPRAPFYTDNRVKKQNKNARFAVLIRNLRSAFLYPARRRVKIAGNEVKISPRIAIQKLIHLY
ncbi:hypothetical protein ACH50_10365 [Franconibacter pulveris]|jgi:hypothetical protein|uniref:Uncharacterized protein n=1 Tax=Franconibacter pulveris TaxID=435910 RepID=A0A0J8YAR1_9ENTR|nr:hypothetical protein ACH50_10365 [Franconibacter pulveris]